MSTLHRVYSLALVTWGLSLSCSKETEAPKPHKPAATSRAAVKPAVKIAKGDLMMVSALPKNMDSADNPGTKEKIDLGRMLYFDKRLSKNHDVSCNSCHALNAYGVDNKPVSDGHKKQKGDRNSPTVYNAAGHLAQFWDGRAKDVEEQAKGPVLNPVEMAMKDEAAVLATLGSIPGYVEAFAKAFPGDKPALTYDNFGKAVGAFERRLVTPSPWDKYLAGDKKALSDAQKAGYNKFVSTGCITCHQGPYLGGSMYKKLGDKVPWPHAEDVGRKKVTNSAEDSQVFKVSSLRNIAKTGPYFHDGSIETLDEAVRIMAKHQLNKKLSDQDVKSIITWLDALTGELPTDYIKEPKLPASSAKTPKADPS